MRITAPVLVAISSLFALNVYATEIFPDSYLGMGQTVGIASDGNTQSYRFRSLADQNVSFALDSPSTFCGAEVTQKGRSGQIKIFRSFPIGFSERAIIGDVFTISFYQNRSAVASSTDCQFSLLISKA